MDYLSRGVEFLSRCAKGARPAPSRVAARQGRRLTVESLEPRQLLALTHLYTFNDGTANDTAGSAPGTLMNGAFVEAGRLKLFNSGVTSGQTTAINYVQLPAGVLPASGSFTVEAWYASNDAANWARLFDIGDQTGANGNSYAFFTLRSASGDSRAVLHPAAATERVATGTATNNGSEHMAAVVVDVDSGLLRLYLDGVAAGTAALSGASAASVNGVLAYIGRSLFNADPGFTGTVNELRIYDEARSAADIGQDAAAGPATDGAAAQRQVEHLDRGMVAIRRSTTQAYVSWRLLGSDPSSVAFNIYRAAGAGAAVKLNSTPIAATTDYSDLTANFAVANAYHVRAVINGVEQPASESFTLAANATVGYYLEVPLQIPLGGTTPSGEAYTYVANDASVGDVDGDGQYEIILKWDPTNAKDNSQSGYTGNVYVDAYKLDGTRLWRIDLGRNVRAGAHYLPFLVYDFNGDGRAEVIMRTAEATVDGVGTVIGNPNADYRNSSGYILSGSEYLTMFNGLTGAIIHSTSLRPLRNTVSSWGDSYGNRVDRFQMSVAYLDGVHPSFVVGRGYAGPQSGFSARNEVAAFDVVNNQIVFRWLFAGATNGQNPGFVGQQAHSITVGDVDGDGKDEIITGASAINDNGALLYNTGFGHGDALHMTDMDPLRPGLEIFMPHEGTGGNGHVAASYRDAATGALIFALPPAVQNAEGEWPDVGRGVAMDIDPNHLGYEIWNTYHGDMYNVDGTAIYAKGNAFTNFGAWWDADLQRELLDGTTISNWNNPGRANIDLDPNSSNTFPPGVSSNNGSKSTPALSGDILGDWREEVIWRKGDSTGLRIFTTPTAATTRMVTLMHDTQYREAIAWQNSGYNQPPHPSFYLGAGMVPPPAPAVYAVVYGAVEGDFNGDRVVDEQDLDVWTKNFGIVVADGSIAGDADGNRRVDGDDFLVWQQNLGAGSPAVEATLAAAVAAEDEGDSSGTPLPSVASAESSLGSLAGAGLPGALRTTASVTTLDRDNRASATVHVLAQPLTGLANADATERPARKRSFRADAASDAVDRVHDLCADRAAAVAASLDEALAGL